MKAFLVATWAVALVSQLALATPAPKAVEYSQDADATATKTVASTRPPRTTFFTVISPSPTPTARTGYIKVLKPSDPSYTAYITTYANYGNTQLTPTLAKALRFTYDPNYYPTPDGLVPVREVDNLWYPWLAATGSDLAGNGISLATGSQDSLSATQSADYDAKSRIWKMDPATGRLSITWTNQDGSKITPKALTGRNQLYWTGDVAAFRAAYSSYSFDQVDLYLIDTLPQPPPLPTGYIRVVKPADPTFIAYVAKSDPQAYNPFSTQYSDVIQVTLDPTDTNAAGLVVIRDRTNKYWPYVGARWSDLNGGSTGYLAQGNKDSLSITEAYGDIPSSRIWIYDQTTGALNISWTNTDGTTYTPSAPLAATQSNQRVYWTGATGLFLDTNPGVALEDVRLYFVTNLES